MTHQFYIELEKSSPLVWRRITLPSTLSLYKFHLAIQGALGWKNSHLFEFILGTRPATTRYGPPNPSDPDPELIDARKIAVNTVFTADGQLSRYLYDFGDYWMHGVTLEKITPEDTPSPRCLDGAAACPPEDVGGIHGYEDMLEAMAIPGTKEANHYRKWLRLPKDAHWDSAFFDLAAANRRLALLK